MTLPSAAPPSAAIEALRAGSLSAEALVRRCLDRIEVREAELLAWAHVEREGALSAARKLDERQASGPLHGVPIGIKDVIDTVDMPTAYGSPIYTGNRPAWDAACVAQIRAAGGIILGKTASTEFAARHPGPTRHPLNLEFSPGGSSSGSAAAVADGMVPLAVGTQTLGSVIRPAAYCGIVGYKPTFGAISRMGVRMLSDSLDTIGLLGRSAEEVALLAGVLTRYVATAPMARPRIGLCRSPQWPHAKPEAEKALDAAAERLARAGYPVAPLADEGPLQGVAEAVDTVTEYEIGVGFTYERTQLAERLSPAMIEIIDRGLGIERPAYEAALGHLEERRRMARALFDKCDILLTPSAPGEAPRGLSDTGPAIFNKVWNALYLPCVTVPAGSGPNGLPVGVQLVGAWHTDADLLGAAGRIAAVVSPEPTEAAPTVL